MGETLSGHPLGPVPDEELMDAFPPTRKPTVELTQMPSRSDFEALKARAHDDCECTEEMKLMFSETGVSCKPCAARHTLNGIATLSESL